MAPNAKKKPSMEMAEEERDNQSCPFCWDQKHKCLRDSLPSECRHCKSYNKVRRDKGLSVDYAPLYYDYYSVAWNELYKNLDPTALISLDVATGSGESNYITVCLRSSCDRTSQIYNLDINDQSNTQSQSVADTLDAIALGTLSAPPLLDRDPNYDGVYMASLICGYTHFLFSTISTTEKVTTTRDNIVSANEHAQCSLHVHFQLMIFSRLRGLLETSVTNSRLEDIEGVKAQYPERIFNTFAAASILRYTVAYFRGSLRVGYLRRFNHVSDGFKEILNDLLEPIEIELTQRIHKGCATYPNWKDAVRGSLKKFRRKDETLCLDLALHQIKFTIPLPQTIPPAPPNPQPHVGLPGDGNVYLLSPQPSPLLQVPVLLYDNPGEIEQLPSHVSGPLSYPYDTWEETSESDARHLFPDLQYPLR